MSLLQILSICTFIITIFYEKFLGGSQQIQAKKGKRKDGKQNQNGVVVVDALSDAEKANILSQVLKELKTTLTDCDKALGKSFRLLKFNNIHSPLNPISDTWKQPSMTTSLVKTLAAMTLDPHVDTIVNNTFKENHTTVVKDLKQILKDKIKMANK